MVRRLKSSSTGPTGSCVATLRLLARFIGAASAAAFFFAQLAAAQSIELRLSVETPPSHARNLASERWAEAIERLSDGAISVRVFPSGQLYGSAGAIKALASGALDLSVQANSTLSSFEPNLSVVALPMFFGATREQVRDILDGPLGQELYDRLESKGILVPGRHFEYAPNNTAYTTRKPVRSYEDLRGLKLGDAAEPALRRHAALDGRVSRRHAAQRNGDSAQPGPGRWLGLDDGSHDLGRQALGRGYSLCLPRSRGLGFLHAAREPGNLEPADRKPPRCDSARLEEAESLGARIHGGRAR